VIPYKFFPSMQPAHKAGSRLDKSIPYTSRPDARKHRGEAVRDMGESSTADAEIVEECIMPVK